MSENKQRELDQAREHLDQAREAHAEALLVRLNDPHDPDTAAKAKDAVQQGKAAWKGYQKAATAGLAEQIEGIVPSDFQEDNDCKG